MTPKYSRRAQLLVNACQAAREVDGIEVVATHDAALSIREGLTDAESALFWWAGSGQGPRTLTLREEKQ